MKIANLTAGDFNDAIKSESKTVVVDFYADWCAPCRMVAPVLEELAQENKDSVVVYKVNIDEHPELATKFDVRSIPNIISFRNGVVYKRTLGVQPKDRLAEIMM